MKFYFSAQFIGILMFIFMIILVVIGLTIGYGWHFVSESIDFVTLQPDADMFSDMAKAVTITALLLPYLVSGYIAGRIANKAEYFNALILAVILIGPFAWFYTPTTHVAWLVFLLPASVMLVGALMAHWTRVNDEKRIARMKQQAGN